MKRHLFAAGKLGVVAQNAETFRADTPLSERARMNAAASNPDAGPCNGGMGPHEGPALRMAEYNRCGWIWTTMADCQACGSTVSRNAFIRKHA